MAAEVSQTLEYRGGLLNVAPILELVTRKPEGENSIDSIYESEKKKSLVTATPLSTAFFLTFIVQDFQDSPDDEEDTRIAITHSLATVYDSADESSFYSAHIPPLEKLAGAKPVSGPKTIKSILKSNSTFKVDTLKGVTINEPSSAPAKVNKNGLTSKNNSASAGKLKNVKTKDDSPSSIVMKEPNDLKLQISKN
ncbi:hypothetical protein Tco_1337329 [Tanacetum coccineum]